MSTRREVPFGRPWITDEDRAAVLRVLEGPVLTHGPEAVRFEDEFADLLGDDARCVAVSSCMAALHLASVCIGIGPGTDVLVPAMTHTAAAHAVEWVGARPVFVDCDPATGNVTAHALEAAITPRTRAISLVHYAGIPCDMPAIIDVARRHGLRVIEDCAIALGARYRGTHVGLFGDVGCFSFYPIKHITTGEGGMLVTRDPSIADTVAKLRSFGVDRQHAERRIPGIYDVPALGLNYRMSELAAALGRSQLRRLPESLERRRANFSFLKSELAALPGVRVIDVTDAAADSSHYCLALVFVGPLASRRDEIVRRLNEAGVGTSVYYPQPVPRMRYYREKYGYDEARYPEAAALSDHSVALPVGPHVSADDARYVAAEVRRVVATTI